MSIRLIQGDITELRVDAIVNAANSSLCGGGGVDGAIHRAAGKELLAVCRNLGGCDAGDAKLTAGFDLPVRYIIHTVGPVWYGGFKNEAALLRSCYQSSMELALKHHVKSIAFPSISCGSYRYPIDQAAEIAIDTLQGFLSQHGKEVDVILVNFDAKTHRIYQKIFEQQRFKQ